MQHIVLMVLRVEFHVLAMAMAASLVVSVGGKSSLDAWLARRLAR